MNTVKNSLTLHRLRTVRWAVRATLTLGVAASVAANILHADPNPISQAIAAWPPLALLLTVELISRIPVHHRALAAVRLIATATIAGIAAWVSYWHMVGVAAHYGETGSSPYLMPLSVDGLVVVASVSLVELAGRIRTAEHDPHPVAVPAGPSSTDRPVRTVPNRPPRTWTGDDPDTAGLLEKARTTAAEHRTTTGRTITRDELRAALRVSNATAGELLRRIRDTDRPTLPAAPAGVFTRTNNTTVHEGASS